MNDAVKLSASSADAAFDWWWSGETLTEQSRIEEYAAREIWKQAWDEALCQVRLRPEFDRWYDSRFQNVSDRMIDTALVKEVAWQCYLRGRQM